MKLTVGLHGAAAVLLLSGLWLRFTRPRLPDLAVPRLPLESVASIATPAAPRDTDYQAVVSSNIFSKLRTPPAARFATPGQRRPATPVVSRESGPTLYGITLGPRGAVALIHAGAKAQSTELYRLGDSVAGAPIVAISESTVTLARPSGPLVLRLAAPAGARQ